MTKKITVVAPTEYEPVVVDKLGESKVFDFKKVPASVIEGYEGLFKSKINYEQLKEKLEAGYKKTVKLITDMPIDVKAPDENTLREFSFNPEKATKNLIDRLGTLSEEIKELHKELNTAIRAKTMELDEERSKYETEREKLVKEELLTRAKQKSLEALSPEELKSCITAGVANNQTLGSVLDHLQKRDIQYKTEDLSEDEKLVCVFGASTNLARVENLFTVYDVVDIYQVFASGELLLVLNDEMRKEKLKEYEETIHKLGEEIELLDETFKKNTLETEKKHDEKIKSLETQFKKDVNELISEKGKLLNDVAFFIRYIEKYSEIPVIRNPVISILYGWVEDDNQHSIESIIKDLEKTGVNLEYYIEEVTQKEIKESKT